MPVSQPVAAKKTDRISDDCDHRRHRKIVKEKISNGGAFGYPFIHWIACAECSEILMPWTENQSLWPRELPKRESSVEPSVELPTPKWDYMD